MSDKSHGRFKAGKKHYIEYICSCGYMDGVSSRQAHKGITCPKCRTELCGPATIVVCPNCWCKTVKEDKRKISYICSCGEKVEAC